MTQNQNEAANGVLWYKCPKTKFCGARRVRIAASETVAVFNTGAARKTLMMTLCGITPGQNSMISLRNADRVSPPPPPPPPETKHRLRTRERIIFQ
jgi:hypothetical protein